MPGLDVRFWPEIGERTDIVYAAVGALPTGVLAGFPRLHLIASLFAGQDVLLADRQLPDVPIFRTDDPAGDASFVECVLTHVLRHHRRLPEYAAQQQERTWSRLTLKRAADRSVGLMGLGSIGGPAARKLVDYGFKVRGWTRRPHTMAGVENFVGPEGLPPFLSDTEILVNLLPFTPATENILRHESLTMLPPGAGLVNLARGQHLVELDLLRLLDTGHLSAATLDVFVTEPLPADSPFWTHPRVTITPHASRELDIDGIASRIAAAIRRFELGEPFGPLVNRDVGY